MTDLLQLALEDLVPSFAEAEPDWADVLTRSPAATRRARKSYWRRRPRQTIALVVALVLIALLATPAFGVQGYVLHLLGRKNVSFSGSPSAPNVVKKQFFDLPLGAPKQFAPQVKAAEARVVATFSIAGHPRKLWVAPTRGGGYCYTFEQSFGGCRQTQVERRVGHRGQFGVTWLSGPSKRHTPQFVVTRVGGDITAPTAAKITVHYADGTTAELPFVWVSAPISAGFYTYDIPRSHWNKHDRVVSLTLTGKDGRLLGRQTFPYNLSRVRQISPVPVHLVPQKPRVLPTVPDVPPSAPMQRGSADGFSVTVGHNGSVQFTQVEATPILEELAGRGVSFACFRLTKEFGIFTARGFGQSGRLAPKVGFTLNGVGMPVDGCEVQASIGHRWPDRLHNRSAAQIPLTAAGRTYFTNREAARDLALFVRSRRMQLLRKGPAAQAKSAILRAYGTALSRSAIRISVDDATTLRFTETSPSGKSFNVVIRNARIIRENLKPYAFVF